MKRKLPAAYFLLYNFIGLTAACGGWLWEVLLFLIKDRQFVNRGFLYGPYLPVYGIGAVILSILFFQKDIAVIITYARLGQTGYPRAFYHGPLYSRLRRLMRQLRRQPCLSEKTAALRLSGRQTAVSPPEKTGSRPHVSASLMEGAGSKAQAPIFVRPLRRQKAVKRKKRLAEAAAKSRTFFVCMFGGSLIEYLTGWFLASAFHLKYWDYSACIFNIHGYVCLYSALGFGIFGLLWIQWIAPHFIHAWERLRFSMQILLAGLSDVLLITDILFSLMQPNSGKNITFR